MPMIRFYVVRLRKDDSIVAVGNAIECARRMKMSLSSFHATVCRCRKGTNKRYEVDVLKGDVSDES